MSAPKITPQMALRARQNRGFTVEQMAKFLDVGVRTVFRWEGQGVPNGPAAIVYRLMLDNTLPAPL